MKIFQVLLLGKQKNKTSYFCVHLFMMQSRYICLSQVSADSPADLSWINSSYYIWKKDYILGLAILGGTEAYFKQVSSPKWGKKCFPYESKCTSNKKSHFQWTVLHDTSNNLILVKITFNSTTLWHCK